MRVSPALAREPSSERVIKLNGALASIYRQWAADYAVDDPALARRCTEFADLLQLRLEAHFR